MATITVCIGNYGYYNEGELHDTWIDLPIPKEDIYPWLKKHRLYDRFHEEIYISDYDGIPLGCSYGDIFCEYTPLGAINHLAKLMELFPDNAEVLEKFITISGEEPENILCLCNWLLQADDLPIFSYCLPDYCDNDSPETKFGEYLAFNSEWWEMLEKYNVSDYFDFAAYGRNESCNVHLGDDAYVDLTMDFPDQNRYDWEEIETIIANEAA